MGYYDVMGEFDILGEDDYDILGEDEMDVLLGLDDYDDEDDLMGFSFKSLARKALMPHTLVTDRLSRKAQAVLDPLGAATRNRRLSTRKAANRLMARKLAQRGTLVRKSSPKTSRRFPIGIDSGANIAAGASLTMTIRPTNMFRPEAVLVDPVIAPNFVIDDIKIGRKSQFVGTTAVPATAFSAANQLSVVSFDTGEISQDISIAVTNITAAASRFRASLLGTAIE